MVEIVVNSALLSPFSPDSEALQNEVSRLETIVDAGFDFETEIDALDTDALLTGDPAFDGTAYVWSGHPQVNGQDVTFSLSGPNLPTLLDLAAAPSIEDAMLAALANLDIDTATVAIGGTDVISIGLSATGITVTSGDQVLEIDIDLSAQPIDLPGIIALFDSLPGVIENGSSTDAAAAIAALDALDLTRIALLDDDETLIELDLDGTDPANLAIGAFNITLEGTGTLGAGSFIAAVELLDSDGSGLAGLNALGLTDLVLTGPNDVEYLSYDFDGPAQTVVTTSATNNFIDIRQYGFGPNFDEIFAYEDLAGLFGVPQPLILDLSGSSDAAGYSVGIMDLAVLQNFGDDGDFTELTFKGGMGNDNLTFYASQINTFFNAYDYDAFNEANNAYYQRPQPSVYDNDAYNEAYEAWLLDQTGPAPAFSDFLDAEVVDIDAYEAAVAAFEAAFIDRYGDIPDAPPNAYSDEFYIGPEDEFDRYQFQPWDFTALFEAQNDWYNDFENQATVPFPTQLDFPINEDKFDHAAIAAAQEVYNAYSSNKPSPGNLEFRIDQEPAPRIEDYLNEDDPRFDFAAYQEALDAFAAANPELAAALEAGYPSDSDYRTSLFASDYVENNQFLPAFDFAAFSEASNAYFQLSENEREDTPAPQLTDFPINLDLYDHDALREAIDLYNLAQTSQPQPFEFLGQGSLTIDLAAETATYDALDFAFDFALESIEDIAFSGAFDVKITGSDDDNQFTLNDLDGGFIDIDGGGGDGDTFNLTSLQVNQGMENERVLTVDDFDEVARVVEREDGGYDLVDRETGEVGATLKNVEFIRIFIDDDDPNAALIPIADLVEVEVGEDIPGTPGPDDLEGMGGDDLINGFGDNDTLKGGEGDDTINGGEGEDTAVYDGDFLEYQISAGVLPDSYTVVSSRPEDAGTDQLDSIERMEFADGVFENALFTADTVTDSPSTQPWQSLDDTYDIDGQQVSRTAVYDDGRTAETSFVDGVRASRTFTDTDNQTPWITVVETYDANGVITEKTTDFDDGRMLVTSFTNGIEASSVMTDDGNQEPFTTYTDTYDAAGVQTLRTIIYDDGRLTEITYDGGVAATRSTTDVDEQYYWSSLDLVYEANGDLASRTHYYDDGRVLVTEFENGVQSSASMTDTDDTEGYAGYNDTFDFNGDLATRDIIYDDGRVTTANYTAGVQTDRFTTDVDDNYYWETLEQQYDANGNLISKTYTLASGAEIFEFI